MSKIRKSAKGQDCQLLIPGVCNYNPETTVCAHIRVKGLCGMGQKPSDLLSLRACSACHDVMDGRAPSPYSRQEIMQMVHEAHCKALVEYERAGLVEVK